MTHYRIMLVIFGMLYTLPVHSESLQILPLVDQKIAFKFLNEEKFLSLMEQYTAATREEPQGASELGFTQQLIKNIEQAQIAVIEELKFIKLQREGEIPKRIISKLIGYEKATQAALVTLRKRKIKIETFFSAEAMAKKAAAEKSIALNRSQLLNMFFGFHDNTLC